MKTTEMDRYDGYDLPIPVPQRRWRRRRRPNEYWEWNWSAGRLGPVCACSKWIIMSDDAVCQLHNNNSSSRSGGGGGGISSNEPTSPRRRITMDLPHKRAAHCSAARQPASKQADRRRQQCQLTSALSLRKPHSSLPTAATAGAAALEKRLAAAGGGASTVSFG